MNHSQIGVCWLLLALSAGLAFGQAGAPEDTQSEAEAEAKTGQTQPVPPARVAVVNLEKTIERYQYAKMVQLEIKKKLAALRKEAGEKTRARELLRFEIDAQEDPARKRELVAKLQRLQAEDKAWEQWQRKKLETDYAEKTEQVLRKVVLAIQRVARRRDVQIVMQLQNLKLGQSPAKTKQTLSKLGVIWADHSVNITDEVITEANREFQQYLQKRRALDEADRETDDAEPDAEAPAPNFDAPPAEAPEAPPGP
jgi:Skp family chaperone for outer membrane proteins